MYQLVNSVTMKFIKILMTAIITIAGNVISLAQTAEEIIAKHIEATGGLDAWKKVNSIKIEGILNIQGNDVTITFIQQHGKGMRQDITVQGMSGYQIVTPTQGWTYLPFQGQTEVTPYQIQSRVEVVYPGPYKFLK